ncbi:MAG: response regulator transcription factor [Bacilli bacterium]|nr:response regulator transcription factor [Bacilli bacterium]
MKILLAEDNVQLNKALSTLLRRNSYVVDAVHDGEEALLCLKQHEYDVIVLDIMMPRVDGLTVLSSARKQGIATPILLLTAKSTVEDKIVGLDAGADDYLPKPFVTEELLARIRALGRRKASYTPSAKREFGDLVIDADSCSIRCGEKSASLGQKEMTILLLLSESEGKMVSAQAMMEAAWDIDASTGNENVWVFVSYLRKKLEAVGSKVKIKSARYQGYYLEK